MSEIHQNADYWNDLDNLRLVIRKVKIFQNTLD